MLRNFFILAIRNTLAHKTFAATSVLGLSLGITCSLLMLLWVRDEIHMDQFHNNGHSLYRVITCANLGEGNLQAYPYTQGLLYREVKKSVPEVEHACAFSWETQTVLTVGDKFYMEKGRFASEDSFNMFSFPLLARNPSSALNAPVNICISQHLAIKYFGSEIAAIGKTIRVDNQRDFQVATVFKNVAASSVKFDYILPWSYFLELNPWLKDWKNTEPHTYIQLHRASNLPQVEAKLTHFLDSYQLPLKNELFLQPFNEAYLYSNFTGGKQQGGRIEYVYMFSVIALFVLLISCINFTNLSTAHSLKRAKEVGVRKVLGANRWALCKQFMGETFLFTSLSMLIALGCVCLLLPLFNELTDKDISLGSLDFSVSLLLATFGFCTGLLSGAYPAFYLSSFHPVRVLKGTFTFRKGAKLFWQGLVTTQFTLAILIIIGTLASHQQLSFIASKNLGYDRENLLYIPMEGDLAGKYSLFKQKLLQMPGVQTVTRMGQTPTSLTNSTLDISWPKKAPTLQIDFMQVPVGYDFIETLDLTLLEGRTFSEAFADSNSYIVNQTALQVMDIKENPLGQPISFLGRSGVVIGVVNDFHFNSLHEKIPPVLIHLDEENAQWGNVLVSLHEEKTGEVLLSIKRLHKQLNPNMPFSYKFASDSYHRLYRTEQVIGQLTSYLAIVAMSISCIGLFGLASYNTVRRKKEIGVRKLLGASIWNIVGMLSKDFLRLVLLASVIAIPISWLAVNKWMENFAYHIPLRPLIFILPVALFFLVALLTVASKTFRAAMANPVKSLRDE